MTLKHDPQYPFGQFAYTIYTISGVDTFFIGSTPPERNLGLQNIEPLRGLFSF